MSNLLRGLGCLLCLVALAGCSGYRFGSPAKLAFQKVYIAPVVNASKLPQATALVSTQLRETFLRDPRVTVVNSPDEADAVLTVKLLEYKREGLASQTGDTGRSRKFDLGLYTETSLRLKQDGAYLMQNRRIEAHRQAYTDLGQLQSEYQTLPLLAETLAANVAAAALDVW